MVRAGFEDKQTDYDIVGLNDQLLRKRIPENIIVTRFVDIYELLKLHSASLFHKKFVYNAFLSTTMLKEFYSMDDIKHHRIPITILIPKGTPGMYLPEVEIKNPEYEVLLPYRLSMKRVGFTTFQIV